MTTQSILVRKEIATGKVISQQLLFDNEDTEHVIISELPLIEPKEGFEGFYIVSETGEVTVDYREVPKTDEQILSEKVTELETKLDEALGMINTMTGALVIPEL